MPIIKSSAEARAERIDAELLAIEKQLAGALRRVGKVRQPRDHSLSRDLTVESKAGSYLRVGVREDGRSAMTPAYAIRVEGAEDASFRSKHRARDFKGLTAKLSTETITNIIKCVEKHLAVKDAATAERAAREVADQKRRKLEKKRDAHLREIGKRHGIRTNYREDTLQDGKLTVTRHNETYQIRIIELSEPELDSLLALWRNLQAETAA